MFRFSLRELALLMAVTAVVLGWWTENRRAHALHMERDALLDRLSLANRLIQDARQPRCDYEFSWRMRQECEVLREHVLLLQHRLRVEAGETLPVRNVTN